MASSKLEISTDANPSSLKGVTFRHSTLFGINLTSAKLHSADFRDCTIEGCNFSCAELCDATFSGSLIIDCDLSRAVLERADFTGINHSDITILVEEKGNKKILDGKDAIGYLQFKGAKTDYIDNYFIIKNHSKFPVVDKILVKLCEHPIRQRVGLEQRGAARQDITLAKSFMTYLEQNDLVAVCKNRKELVELTEYGREIINLYSKSDVIPAPIAAFFE